MLKCCSFLSILYNFRNIIYMQPFEAYLLNNLKMAVSKSKHKANQLLVVTKFLPCAKSRLPTQMSMPACLTTAWLPVYQNTFVITPGTMVLVSIPLVIISTLAVISFLGTSFIFSSLSSSLSASFSGAAPDRISPYTYGHTSGYTTMVEKADIHSPSLVPWAVVPSILGVSIG